MFKEAKSLSDVNTLINNNRKAMVMYGMSDCSACNNAKPKVKKIASSHPNIPVMYVDMGKLGIVSREYPLFRFMYKGQEIKREVGDDVDKVGRLMAKFAKDTKR